MPDDSKPPGTAATPPAPAGAAPAKIDAPQTAAAPPPQGSASASGPTAAPGDTAAAAKTANPGTAPAPQAAAPEKPKIIKLTIDDVAVECAPGTNLIEAARKVGSDIPYYCYHPKLSIAANCRMCLVEASNAPKLVPACQTPVAEGAKIQTKSAKVKDAQRATLEFILLNHPVDCSICDQAGECKLQDYYMKYDFKPSRLTGLKVLKSKRHTLGPLVVLDQERCILCTRCVRFMAEIPKEPQLGVFGRGSHEMIDVFPGRPLDSNYSGNTIDICPVGALLSRDFRFKARAFFLTQTPSVCTGCSRGCSTFLDSFNDESYRYRPRENAKVNDVWMCDQGRLSYKYLNAGRALTARIGKGEGKSATREEAARVAAEKLKPFIGKDALAVVASPLASVEDLLATLKLAKEHLKVSAVYVSGRPEGQADHLLMRADKNPNRKGLEWVAKAYGLALKSFDDLTKGIEDGKLKAVYAVGGEVPTDAAVAASIFHGLEVLVLQAFNLGPIAAEADVLLPASPHSEDHGTLVNFDGHTQRFAGAYLPTGESRPHWAWAASLHAELGEKAPWTSARDVFRELSAKVTELEGFKWDSLHLVKGKRGIMAMPAAADGRPAGFRERSLL